MSCSLSLPHLLSLFLLSLPLSLPHLSHQTSSFHGEHFGVISHLESTMNLLTIRLSLSYESWRTNSFFSPLYSYPFLHCLLCIHFFGIHSLFILFLLLLQLHKKTHEKKKFVSIFSSYFSPLTWRSDFKEWNMFSTFFLPLFVPSRFSCLIIIFHAFLSFHTPFSPLSTTLLVWWSEKMNE